MSWDDVQRKLSINPLAGGPALLDVNGQQPSFVLGMPDKCILWMVCLVGDCIVWHQEQQQARLDEKPTDVWQLRVRGLQDAKQLVMKYISKQQEAFKFHNVS